MIEVHVCVITDYGLLVFFFITNEYVPIACLIKERWEQKKLREVLD